MLPSEVLLFFDDDPELTEGEEVGEAVTGEVSDAREDDDGVGEGADAEVGKGESVAEEEEGEEGDAARSVGVVVGAAVAVAGHSRRRVAKAKFSLATSIIPCCANKIDADKRQGKKVHRETVEVT